MTLAYSDTFLSALGRPVLLTQLVKTTKFHLSVYIELGDIEEDDSATLTFTFDDVNFPSLNRRWEIKALQIGCFSEMA